MPCFAPLIMLGTLLSLNSPWHHVERQDGVVMDIQTCKTGAGVHATASMSGLYAAGLHYGMTYSPRHGWEVTLQPRFGVSYVDHPVLNKFGVNVVPLRTQFELGLMGLASYDRYHASLEYLHFSNAGLRPPNQGMDSVLLMMGIALN